MKSKGKLNFLVHRGFSQVLICPECIRTTLWRKASLRAFKVS